jgi:transposase
VIEIFKQIEKILGLPEFRIKRYEIFKDEIYLYVEIKAKKAYCPRCGKRSKSVHQYHERKVRDLDVFGKHCYLIFEIRRFDCDNCKNPFTEHLYSVGFNSEYTKRFEDWVVKLARNSALDQVAQNLGMTYERVEGIFFRAIKRQVEANKGRIFKKIGIDEISKAKGKSDYIAVITDLSRGVVIGVLEERTKDKVKEWLSGLSKKQLRKIRWVAIDMWDGFFYAVREVIPWAVIVIDRFHVQKALGKKIDKARMNIQNKLSEEDRKELKGSRWIILKPKDKLTKEELATLETICQKYPELAHLHELKEDFRTIYEKKDLTPITAKKALDKWQQKVKALGIKVLDNFLNTLNNWYRWILNYFGIRLTSGCVEGINTKIKLLKRIAFGFWNFENFRLRIFGAFI